MGALEDMLAKIERMDPKQVAALAKVTHEQTKHMVWVPNPGPQTDAYNCKADILLYGGEPGGGKTNLLIGLAMNCHQRSLIMRRQYTDLGRIVEDLKKVNGGDKGFVGAPYPKLTRDGKVIDLRAAARAGDEQHMMGDRHDFIGLDEGTHFTYEQVRFLLGWLGTTDPRQRTRMVIATNPPLTAEGLWAIQMFAPWLDERHPNPARTGELRWFITDDEGNDREVSGPSPVAVGAKLMVPMSRTYIPASVRDNPFLARTDYESKLDSMTEPYRSILMGHFKTIMKDQDGQCIPTAWIRAAQQRWTSKPPDGVPMCAIGVDCSGGGEDPLILAIRHDGWFDRLIEVRGKDLPQESIGSTTAGIIISHRRDRALVVLDMGGGYGGSAYEHLKGNDVEVRGYRGAEGTERRSREGKSRFTNKRSAAYWLFREALDPGQPGGSPIALPDDPVLVADLTGPTFEPTPNGIKVEPKEKLCERLGRSTDRGDAVVMAWHEGPRESSHALEWMEQKPFRAKRGGMPQVILGRAGVQAQRRAGVRR